MRWVDFLASAEEPMTSNGGSWPLAVGRLLAQTTN